MSIDTIDTINMKVELTLQIRMTWLDSRLKFANLLPGSKNMVRYETVDDLWIPLDYVQHSNAFIGKIFQDLETDVELSSPTSPMPMNPDDAIQNTMYSGTNTIMEVAQSYRIMYKCTFNLRNFPFDRQACTFIMTMKTDKYSNVSFAKHEPAVEYKGPKMVRQFEIGEIEAFANDKMTKAKSETTFKFTVAMDRISTDMLIKAFFPTILLWLLVYFTLFISTDHFNERIMVAVTVLLVLVALLSSIDKDLPHTSYFKYIDVWFCFYICNIFAITTFHIALKKMDDGKMEKSCTTGGGKIGITDLRTNQKYTPGSKKIQLNHIAKNIFIIAFFIFNAIYFPIQTRTN